jgi:ubiquinone biosynthesis protein Coq4
MLDPIAIAPELKAAWEGAVNDSRIAPADVAALVAAFRAAPPTPGADAVDDERLADALWASVLLARVAFVLPELGMATYDRLAALFLDGVPLAFTAREVGDPLASALAAPNRMAPELSPALGALIQGGVDGDITPRTAARGALHPAPLRDACARAMRQHPGFEEFRSRPPMRRLTMDHLQGRGADSLGETLRRLIVDNGYDLDVLDPETVAGYHPELDDSNRYILQTHEIWHLVAGYSTSPGHEVAISGFQLAQFGHPYSRDFLAAIVALTTFTAPVTAGFVLQLALEGWRHGRQSPPLTLVDWHARLDDSLATIRDREGIAIYQSLIPDSPPAPVA